MQGSQHSPGMLNGFVKKEVSSKKVLLSLSKPSGCFVILCVLQQQCDFIRNGNTT